MTEFIAAMNELPNSVVYAALAVGAGLENFVPAIPADTFVALGGFLAGAGDLQARWVVLGTWLCNVAGALSIFGVSRRHGPTFFEHGLGRHIVRPHQMRRMSLFYDRWGTAAIFFSRFLPGVRTIVPIFAGTTCQSWPRVIVPITFASAIWYGGLVQVGLFAGHNLDTLSAILNQFNTTLGVTTTAVGLAVGIWWLRTRHHPHE